MIDDAKQRLAECYNSLLIQFKDGLYQTSFSFILCLFKLQLFVVGGIRTMDLSVGAARSVNYAITTLSKF